jgi:RNA polymerase sigma factor (TIGR02999 family)
MTDRHEITRLLRAFSEGDPGAFDRLFPLLYDRLKAIARSRLRGERRGHTLNTTGLVHEAYLKLTGTQDIAWQDRAHFMAIASRVMRQILITAARNKRALKRGAGQKAVQLDDDLPISDSYSETLLDLDDGLDRLGSHHSRAAEVLQHKYFAGYTNEEIAALLGVSLSTVERDLRFGRAWLGRDWESIPKPEEADSHAG